MIDNIITNSFFKNNVITGIIKIDINDHFPIFIIANNLSHDTYTNENVIFKRYINDTSKNHSKLALTTVNWEEITNTVSLNKTYDEFLKIFSSLYDISFPEVNIKVKTKIWIIKGSLKSSKIKHKVYKKILNHKT